MSLFRSDYIPMKHKNCIQCGESKPLTEYYKHPAMADGTVGVCKVCHKGRMKARRRSNPAVQAYDRWRYHNDPERKKVGLENSRKWNREHPTAYTAHNVLHAAVRDGKIKKPKTCQWCAVGSLLHGHHEDYRKPLDVIWLCVTCHQRGHADGLLQSGH